MGMQLTEENYYSDIANYEYMSVSQFKDFNGTYGRVGLARRLPLQNSKASMRRQAQQH